MADGHKTEKPTPRRLKKAREAGQIARSRELPATLTIAVASAVTLWLGPTALAQWVLYYRSCMANTSASALAGSGPVMFWSSVEVLRWLSPILLAGMMVALFAGFAQGGFNFAPQALAPKFDRFNPATRLGQIFSTQALNGLLRSLVPVAVILWIAITSIKSHWTELVYASELDARPFGSLLESLIVGIGWKACLVLLAWSGIDYAFTWFRIQSQLKMTKQELKEEFKETEGNPLIKQRVRQIQRQMRKRLSLKAAATATVIVTNPTHFAVALRYEADMPAPIVVAKGRDLIAQKIKEIGRENGIMLVENKPLAQALYKSVEVGESIPSRLYQAVAEILAMVYRAEAELRRQEAERRSRNASGQKITPATGPGGTKQ
jgi:flagellar biosynthetic protein FlhB